MAVELIDEILPHIENSIYPYRQPIGDWKVKEGEIVGAHGRKFNDKSWSTFAVPGTWGRYDKTFWFRRSIAVPPEWAGKPVVLLIDIPEGLLYVDGEPYQGVDLNHGEILLTPKARTNQSMLLAIEAYSGRKNDLNKFHHSDLAVIDANARALFSCLKTLRDLEGLVTHGSQEFKNIRELIRRTLIFLKYFKPGSDEYPHAIDRAYNFLINTLNTEPQANLPGVIHLVGQSHLDVAWLWTTRETRKKCARTFSTALRLMELAPEFRYTQSQAVLYEYTKDQYPGLYRQLKQRVTEGRWEVIGGTWVEPDCNIPNGESLVRQILYGKRYFKSEFGIDTNTFWLPDSFGFSGALPQILRKSGIDRFFTTKLSWNDTNKFPHNTFWWKGIDGSKVLAHQPPVGLGGSVLPKDVAQSWEEFAQKEQNCTHVLQTFGYGDGGGGPTLQQIEVSRVLRNNSGIPQAIVSTADEFFRAAAEQTDGIPTWSGDLYLEKHRGSFTTHGWIKRANRLAERGLYTAELLSVLGLVNGKSPRSRVYPQRELEEAWKRLLVNQFHDIVTGTSIPDALEEANKGFQEIEKSTFFVIKRALSGLTQKAPKSTKEFRFSFFNTLPWGRNEYVEVELPTSAKNVTVSDSDGKPVEYQVIGTAKGSMRLLCYIRNIPPLSFISIVVRPSALPMPNHDPWEFSAKHAETPLFRLRTDAKGFFSSIYDKTLRKELIEKGKRGNQLQAFKDTPKQWDAWDIDSDFERQHLELFELKKHQVLETGPLRGIVRNTYVTPNGSELVQDVAFYHKRPQIVFATKARWKEKQTLLKAAFSLNVKSTQATYETQFGVITRSTKHKTDLDRAQFELPIQQWTDLSDVKIGVSLLNDCKYGSDARDTTMRLTLLRSPFYPHPTEPWRFNDVKHTDQGEHVFSYAFMPHAGSWKQGETTRHAREFNNPLLGLGQVEGNDIKPLVTASKSSIFIDSVKKAEDSDDVVVRLHEGNGDSLDANLLLGFKPKGVAECDLMEQPLKPLKIAKNRVQLKFKPFEIKTIKLELRGSKKS